MVNITKKMEYLQSVDISSGTLRPDVFWKDYNKRIHVHTCVTIVALFAVHRKFTYETN